jgi:O-antigen ligase
LPESSVISRISPPPAERTRVWVATTLLLTCLFLGGGGGGTPEPILELIIETVAGLAVLAWLWLSPAKTIVFDPILWLGVAVFVAIPLIQLIPLPPTLWHALPGRMVETRSLALVGGDASWRPLSVDAPQTFASFLSLAPPILLLFFVSQLGLRSRAFLLLVVGAFGLFSAIVGAAQVAAGNADRLRFYTFTHNGFATGFMANRNHQADVILIAIAALATWAWANKTVVQRRTQKLLLASALVVLVFSVVLTGSRMGTALLVIALGGTIPAFVSLFRSLAHHLLTSGIVIALVLAVGAMLAWTNPALQRTWHRYELQREGRWDLWPDALFAAKTYWPVGAGVGNFIPVFRAAENLDAVDDTYPVRAHNDYLEFAIESGFFGLLILAGLAAALFIRIYQRFRTVGQATQLTRPEALFAATAIGVVALHSIVDYPLRTMAVSSLAALAIGMVSRVRVGGNNA